MTRKKKKSGYKVYLLLASLGVYVLITTFLWVKRRDMSAKVLGENSNGQMEWPGRGDGGNNNFGGQRGVTRDVEMPSYTQPTFSVPTYSVPTAPVVQNTPVRYGNDGYSGNVIMDNGSQQMVVPTQIVVTSVPPMVPQVTSQIPYTEPNVNNTYYTVPPMNENGQGVNIRQGGSPSNVSVPSTQRTVTVVPTARQNKPLIESIKTQIQSWGVGFIRPAATPTPTPIEEPGQLTEQLKVNQVVFTIDGGGVGYRYLTNTGGELNAAQVDSQGLVTSAMAGLGQLGVELVADGGKLRLIHGGVASVAEVPLVFNLETKELNFITSDGNKKLKIYPDKAIGVVETIDSGLIITNETTPMRIIYKGGELVYAFDGMRNYKAFGMFDLKAPATDFVSAESGEYVGSEQPVQGKIVRFFSK